MTRTTDLLTRAQRLQLHGLIAQWATLGDAPWLEPLLAAEEHERTRRSQERRLRNAQLGRFKPIADFDWTWPTRCDRPAVETLLRLEFMAGAGNAVLIGPNGIGKTTIARNLAHQAVLAGHTVLFTTAAAMLNDLAAQDGDLALKRRLNRYVRPALLVIDEVGYLAYGNRHADLLFEIVSRRYEQKATVVTTNRPFAEWGDVFPNAPCVVSLIDRLIHHAEIIAIEGESYRLKEARERAERNDAAKSAKATLRTRRKSTEDPSCTTP
jgi:DNA replication protein DnaC